MKCPQCAGVELKIAERQGVEIDYCPECRGIWLDRGELDKIIDRSYSQQQPAYVNQPEAQPQPAYQPHYQQHHDKHHTNKHGYGSHGRKSWLSELFD